MLCGSAAASLFFSGDTAAKTLGEAVNTTTGSSFFLLASVEGVTFFAHVYVQGLTQSRASLESAATAATNSNFNVIWMDISFHDVCLDVICAATRAFAEHRTTVKKNGGFLKSGDTSRFLFQGKRNLINTRPY